MSDLDKKKILRVSENTIRSSVEKRQRRFRCIISNKHKLSIHQSSRKRSRLRLRDHVMSRRSGETLDCLFNLSEETLLVEIKWSSKQPPLGRIRNPL